MENPRVAPFRRSSSLPEERSGAVPDGGWFDEKAEGTLPETAAGSRSCPCRDTVRAPPATLAHRLEWRVPHEFASMSPGRSMCMPSHGDYRRQSAQPSGAKRRVHHRICTSRNDGLRSASQLSSVGCESRRSAICRPWQVEADIYFRLVCYVRLRSVNDGGRRKRSPRGFDEAACPCLKPVRDSPPFKATSRRTSVFVVSDRCLHYSDAAGGIESNENNGP